LGYIYTEADEEDYISEEEYARAEANGITRTCLIQRIRKACWDREDALTRPMKPQRPRDSLKQWRELAEKSGISKGTFWARVSGGMSPEEAATMPKQSRQDIQWKRWASTRKTPAEFVRLAEKNGINTRTFHSRIHRGMDPQEAATRPPMSPQEAGSLGGKTGWGKSRSRKRKPGLTYGGGKR